MCCSFSFQNRRFNQTKAPTNSAAPERTNGTRTFAFLERKLNQPGLTPLTISFDAKVSSVSGIGNLDIELALDTVYHRVDLATIAEPEVAEYDA